MKKSIIPVAAFIAGMAIVPSVFADTTLTLGAVSDYTSENTIFDATTDNTSNGWKTNTAKATLTSNLTVQQNDVTVNNKDVTLKYSGLNLNYVPADADGITRPTEAAWLGFQVTMPTNLFGTGESAKNIREIFNGEEELIPMASSDKTITRYVGVTKGLLEKAAKKGEEFANLGVFEYDYDNDGTIDQTIRVVVETKNTTLYQLATDEDGEVTGVDTVAIFDRRDAEELFGTGVDDEPADEGDDKTDDGETNPNTADSIATYLTIATVALLGLGATAFVAKKSNR